MGFTVPSKSSYIYSELDLDWSDFLFYPRLKTSDKFTASIFELLFVYNETKTLNIRL